MRETILHRYVDAAHIYEILGRDVRCYIKIALGYTTLALMLALTYRFLIQPLAVSSSILGAGSTTILLRIRSIAGVGLYLKCLYDIFDEYLDVLLITEQGLIHFRRDGLRSHRSNILQRVSIEAVSDTQNSLRDRLMKKGDVFVKLEDTLTTFREIEEPSEATSKILYYKNKILGRQNHYENEVQTADIAVGNNSSGEKYQVLVEALGDVINEYVEQKERDSNYY